MSQSPRRVLFTSPGPKAKKQKTNAPTGMQVHKAIMRQTETKHHTQTVTSPGAATNWAESVVSSLGSGSAGNQRVGNKIKITSIDVSILSTYSKSIRCRLVMDRGTGSSNIAALPNILSHYDPTQYWTIKDFFIQPNFEAGSVGTVYSHKFGLGKNLSFSGGTVLSDNIYVVFFAPENIGIGIVNAQVQVNFKDL